jgi:hypothetical protein
MYSMDTEIEINSHGHSSTMMKVILLIHVSVSPTSLSQYEKKVPYI